MTIVRSPGIRSTLERAAQFFRRKRKNLIWVATSICVSLILVFIASLHYYMGYVSFGRTLVCRSGAIVIQITHGPDKEFREAQQRYPPSFVLKKNTSPERMTWLPNIRTTRPKDYRLYYTSKMTTIKMIVPLWLLLLPAVACCLWVVLAKEEREVGTCISCGYDLRGNLSGLCPECGTPISKAIQSELGADFNATSVA